MNAAVEPATGGTMRVRAEQRQDHAAVHRLNREAFAGRAEADLVDRLREQARPFISLVAESEAGVIGHLMLTPLRLEGFPGLKCMGLAPLAVAPGQQRQGTGSALVREGMSRCLALEAGAIAVLGHPGYYPRFGFVPSSRFGIRSTYEVPEEAFMIAELAPGFLAGAHGIIRYHPAFDGL